MTTWNTSDANNPWLGSQSFSGGDLTATVTAGGFWVSARATTPVDAATADHYFEVNITSFSSFAMIGVCLSSVILGAGGFWAADGYGYYSAGDKYDSGGGAAYGASYGADRIGVHLKAGKLYFLKNGVYQNSGDPTAGTGYAFTGLTGDFYPVASIYDNGDSETGAFTAADLIDLPAGTSAWDGTSGSSVTGEIAGDLASIAGEMVGLLVPTGGLAGDLASISGEMGGLLVPTGELAGDFVGIAGSMAGESGVIGAAAGELPSIAGDFPGGQGFFAAMAGDVVGIAGDMPGIVAQSGEFAGDLPLIAGEFIGGYSVAGTAAGDLPLISGAFAGYTAVASTIDGTLPLIAGSFVGGMATVGAIAGDLPLITGAFNDGPVGVISGSLPLISGDAPGYVGTAAAGIWLYLHTIPPAQVYDVDALRGRMNPLHPMMRVPFSVSDTAAQLGQQNDNFRVSLDRPSATLRRLLATQAPYGVRVDVMDGGTLSRTGMVSSVDAGADGFDLDCESAGWTDDLPLRTNADLGIFRDVVPLPWRYGRNVAGKCIRLGATGKRWLWADHASSRIASVAVDALPYDGWQWRNETDADGNAITVIETVDALEDGADVVATGDGAMDALSGDLMTNPADIVGDICRRGGKTIDRGDLSAFRVECHARLLEIAGSVESGSLQSALVNIADSIYAVFSRSLQGLMRLRPRSSPTVTIRAADTQAGSASRDGIATRLRIRYALEDGKPRASMALRAPSVEALRGIVVAEVTLPWVSDARVAADVGGRILGDRARPRYTVRAARQLRRIVPGDVVTASVASLSLSGPALVTASAIADRGSTPVLELAAGTAPATEILSSSIAYTPEQYTGATVTTQGNDRVIVITDDTGAPLAGAACLLDGATTRFTDGAGKVAFPLSLMPPGPHTIYVTASGFDPFTLTVVVS